MGSPVPPPLHYPSCLIMRMRLPIPRLMCLWCILRTSVVLVAAAWMQWRHYHPLLPRQQQGQLHQINSAGSCLAPKWLTLNPRTQEQHHHLPPAAIPWNLILHHRCNPHWLHHTLVLKGLVPSRQQCCRTQIWASFVTHLHTFHQALTVLLPLVMFKTTSTLFWHHLLSRIRSDNCYILLISVVFKPLPRRLRLQTPYHFLRHTNALHWLAELQIC